VEGEEKVDNRACQRRGKKEKKKEHKKDLPNRKNNMKKKGVT